MHLWRWHRANNSFFPQLFSIQRTKANPLWQHSWAKNKSSLLRWHLYGVPKRNSYVYAFFLNSTIELALSSGRSSWSFEMFKLMFKMFKMFFSVIHSSHGYPWLLGFFEFIFFISYFYLITSQVSVICYAWFYLFSVICYLFLFNYINMTCYLFE